MGGHGHCRNCQRICRKEWYEKNKDIAKEKARIYSKSEQAKRRRKLHWKENKERIKKKNNERRRSEKARKLARAQRSSWLSNPKNKIACNLRCRLRKAMKGIAKSSTTKELIGCTFEELKELLEKKFKSGMSWDNYGEWHIDHITP